MSILISSPDTSSITLKKKKKKTTESKISSNLASPHQTPLVTPLVCFCFCFLRKESLLSIVISFNLYFAFQAQIANYLLNKSYRCPDISFSFIISKVKLFSSRACYLFEFSICPDPQTPTPSAVGIYLGNVSLQNPLGSCFPPSGFRITLFLMGQTQHRFACLLSCFSNKPLTLLQLFFLKDSCHV